ncbi:hypothetical protein Bca52824_027881 [Brassica carinata]|uniref:Uncharacterized protein n=1 Tax=Brassica carinata TaxID=52824 RepID=A0A8X7VB91_BRACI|nr:hypothetical protein Bca52824_027881 [Brassica carinata]
MILTTLSAQPFQALLLSSFSSPIHTHFQEVDAPPPWNPTGSSLASLHWLSLSLSLEEAGATPPWNSTWIFLAVLQIDFGSRIVSASSNGGWSCFARRTQLHRRTLSALLNLSINDNNKSLIAEAGAIEQLIHVFREREQGAIVQSGAVRYLIDLMDPAAGMVDKALTIPEGRNAIGQEGGIGLLVEVVELGSARGKENAAAALLQLSTNSGRFCNMVLQEGAVPPLVALSQSGTPRARERHRHCSVTSGTKGMEMLGVADG